MASQFDELAKNLAGGMSRREALRRFGLGLVGALMASLGLGALTPRAALGQNNCNSNCFYFCKAVYPNDAAAQAACQAPGGLCSQCGPCAVPRRALCGAPGANSFCCPTGQSCCNNSTCFNLQGDLSNCGTCGHVCGTGFNKCCAGACVNTSTDANNCGSCGNVCPTPANAASVFCSGGNCGFTCQPGFTSQNGQCVSTSVCTNPQQGCEVCRHVCRGDGNSFNFCCCFQTAEGGTACTDRNCLSPCSASSDCPTGQVCIVNTCCGGGWCSRLCISTAATGVRMPQIAEGSMRASLDPGVAA